MGLIVLPVLSAIAWFYYLLPRGCRRKLGHGLGALLRHRRVRASVIEQNLKFAYPEAADTSKRQELFRQAYEHLGCLVFEVLLLFGPMGRYLRKEVELSGVENWRQARAQGKGVLFLSSHVGNWEVMAGAGALLAGMDLIIVTKHLKPEWLHRAIERGRRRVRFGGAYEPRTLKEILAQLKRGETVGFVLDQYAGPPVGVRVPVFGIPTGTTSVVAMLAKRTGAVVVPVVNYRTPEGRWKVEIRPALQWAEHADPNYELGQNTALYAAELEKDIHAHPDQWLWIHRRFKGDLSPLRSNEWSEPRARH